MANGSFQVPFPVNEPVLSYAPGSSEREELQKMYNTMYNQSPIDVPMYIGADLVTTGDKRTMTPPHDHAKVLGHFNYGDASHVEAAIEAALDARKVWSKVSFVERATIFLKAADLVAGPYRAKLNAATMLAQSKNCFQAEIDASCELADFLRFNAYFAQEIQTMQPESSDGFWNRTEYRPLEGFVFAVTREAGVPDGVINMITVDGPVAGDVVFKHPDFAGLHFTGSTAVFRHLWKTIGDNLSTYKTYPRIVGETGGKDFIVAHSSANRAAVSTGLLRGSFEYQGQKCSAASRAYISDDIWPDVKEKLVADLATLKMGSPEDFGNFINAVIDKRSFDKIKSYIDWAKGEDDCEIISGGNCDDSVGYFIEPTVIVTTNPMFRTMVEEIFGPVLTIYVFEADKWEETLELVDSTSEYALTGAVFAQDRYALNFAKDALENAAGNFYLNDKPTGAVVGQQPFGGARGSGTNDKAGSALNLLRWVSPRTVKETLVPVEDYHYPFLG
jgi:1-pyrroline-5-carboxylate dehydrogenase